MTLHWHNNDFLTHVGADYLRCDIYDFPEREIRPEEVKSVQYTAKRIRFGALPAIAVVVNVTLAWAFARGARDDRIDLKGVILCAGMEGLFGLYVVQRVWHCTKNKRRAVELTLTDGVTGTFIELEDDSTFRVARDIIDGYLQNPTPPI